MCFRKVSNEVLLIVLWHLSLRWTISVLKCVRMNRSLYVSTVKTTGFDPTCGWSETVLASFKVVSRKCPGETLDDHDS
jgi:hypothetical protein